MTNNLRINVQANSMDKWHLERIEEGQAFKPPLLSVPFSKFNLRSRSGSLNADKMANYGAGGIFLFHNFVMVGICIAVCRIGLLSRIELCHLEDPAFPKATLAVFELWMQP